MFKYITLSIFLLTLSQSFAMGLVGGPVFCIGQNMTSMTVEMSKVNMEVKSQAGKESAISQRMFLTGRYGVAPKCDIEGRLGMADLSFTNSPSDYSNYKSNFAFAWGAGIRAGLPFDNSPYQLTGSVSYVGFQAKGNTKKGEKDVSTKYLWHEVSPAVTFGYRFGQMLPYIGATKPWLLGQRNVSVSFAGKDYNNAGSKEKYTDAEQEIRGLFGLEWKLPQGYSITAEAAATQSNLWSLSLGVAQVLK